MEAADAQFMQVMRYLRAAKRCERWGADDDLRAAAGKLAALYRRNAMALTLGGNLGATSEGAIAAPPLGTLGENQQTSAPGLGSNALGWE